MSDIVSITTGGKTLKGWTSVRVTAGVSQAARSFAVGVTFQWPDARDVISGVDLGESCEVYIGSDLVCTGYIFATPISYDAQSVTVSVAGRSKTADIVDCCPPTASYSASGGSSSGSSDSWAGTGLIGANGQKVQASSSTSSSGAAATQWKDVKLEAIAAELCAPFGVEVTTQVSTGAPITQHAVQPGETVFESINRLLTVGQLFATDDAAGRLVFTEPGAGGRASGGIELGVNALTCSSARDASQVFSSYIVEGQRSGSDEVFSTSAAQISAGAADGQIPRYRLLALPQSGEVTPDLCQKIANFEATRRRALLKQVTYTVAGWRDASGTLWTPNSLVHVKNTMLGLDEDLLLSEVEYRLDEGGTVAQLTLAPIEAFKQGPAVPKKSSSSDSSSSMWSEVVVP